ncbi:hemerythrin domain-containing protein [Actinomadura parmotrematis]|uniref:Hemerythrin domain-containing protein n=1 Tax=Actinomadura parmotrematis TaxID=2864039 RepID=A0ABS7FRV5_9ACTN|nr:hemerythrin domain-containing protein [Actinomadura parmotrematis]MBW8482950.1 hemerythrin domain-containing protein [Actinomadura parmotrematis]
MSTTTATPDTLGFRLAHRAMRGEARRLAGAVARVAQGEPCDRARAEAITGFVLPLCTTVHHHHSVEDHALWPVILRSAGSAADFSDLIDDHAELDRLIDRIRAAAGAFDGTVERARPLAAELAALAGSLDEHIAEEEKLIFPLIERYVPVADWLAVEKQALEGADNRNDLPRMERFAPAAELAEFRAKGGLPLRVILAVVRRGYRRRELRAFGQGRGVR